MSEAEGSFEIDWLKEALRVGLMKKGVPPERIIDFLSTHSFANYAREVTDLLDSTDADGTLQYNMRPGAKSETHSGDLDSSALEETQDADSTQLFDPDQTLDHAKTGESFNFSYEKSRFAKIKEHAQGGLGKVFVAADHEINREVALKTIRKEHCHDPSAQKRFVLEAQVTGTLEHPGIVPIYSLNVEEDGTPFYAMRFVEGSSLKEEIAKIHGATNVDGKVDFFGREFRELLRRFIDVCNAIHFAHSRGVLHRDIKPDNIMLGGFGETLVVDWGLAKVLSESDGFEDFETSQQSTVDSSTLVGDRLGTPRFMSPEQAQGLNDRLTPATDIYSLGATLFNILTNDFASTGRNVQEIIRDVSIGKIRSAREINAAVPWALDAICAKALSLETENRYGDARALANDIDCWLADEPISSQPEKEPVVERAGRVLRRYRSWTVPVAIATVVVVCVLGLATLLIENARRGEVEAKRAALVSKEDAQDRFEQSQSVIGKWFLRTSRDLDYFPATATIRKRLLGDAVDDLGVLVASASDDPNLELERIRTQTRIGDIHSSLSETDEATSAYRLALDWIDKGESAAKADPNWLAEKYRIQGKLALLTSGDGSQSSRISLPLRELMTLREQTGETVGDESLAELACDYAESLLSEAKYDLLLKNLGELQGTIRTLPDSTLYSLRLGLCRVAALTRTGEYQDALAQAERERESLVPLLGNYADNPPLVEQAARLLIAKADALRTSGRTEECTEPLLQAVEEFRVLSRALPDIPAHQNSLAIGLLNLGLVQFDLNEFAESSGTLSEAASVLDRVVQYYPLYSDYRVGLASVLDGLAQCEEQTGNFEAAYAYASEARNQFANLAQSQPVDANFYIERHATATSHLASILAKQGAVADSRTLFGDCEQLLRQLLDADDRPELHNTLAHVMFKRGELEFDAGEKTEAEKYFRFAIEQWNTSLQQSDSEGSRFQCAWFYLNCPIEELVDVDQAYRLMSANEIGEEELATVALFAEAAARGGKNEQAQGALKMIESRRGNLIDVELLTKARIATASGDSESAEQLLKAADEWHKTHRPGNRRIAKAITLLRQQITNTP